jgi:hypothetical protein
MAFSDGGIRGKKIPLKWIEWIQQVVTRGIVGINLNDELGNFFRTSKGLR